MKVKVQSLRSLIMFMKDQRLKAASEPKREIRNDCGRAFKVTEGESSLKTNPTQGSERKDSQAVREAKIIFSPDKYLILRYLFICSFCAMKF